MGERIIEGWIFLAGLLAIIVLLAVLFVLLREGLPVFTLPLRLGIFLRYKVVPGVSDPPTFGILPFFVSTLMVTANSNGR